MVKVEINGKIVEFASLPTEADIDEAANQLDTQNVPPTEPTLGDQLSKRKDAFLSAPSTYGNTPRTPLRMAGAVAGGLNDVIGAAAKPVFNAVVDKISNNKAVQFVSNSPLNSKALDLINSGVEKTTDTISGLWNSFAQSTPEIAQDVKDVGNIASLLPIGKGAVIGAKTSAKAAANTAKSILPTAESVAAKGTAKILTKTKGIQTQVGNAAKKNVDLQKYIQDPAIYDGLKVEGGKVNPDQAISTFDNRIDTLMNSRSRALPAIDKYHPGIKKTDVRTEAIRDIAGQTTPAQELELIKAIDAELAPLPDIIPPSQLDLFRAQARKSARDAKGIMKRNSEYVALEKAARDKVFEATDNLPFDTNGEFASLTTEIKNMIEARNFLDKTLRGQTLPGGRLGNIAARGIGAMVGAQGGIITTILGAETGGLVQSILVNNNLGSSMKFQLIKGITDDPRILKIAQEYADKATKYRAPQLPPPGGTGSPTINLPPKFDNKTDYIPPATPNATIKPSREVQTRLDDFSRYQSRETPNISLQNTANNIVPITNNIPQSTIPLPQSKLPVNTTPPKPKKGAVSSPGTKSSKQSKATSTSTSNAPIDTAVGSKPKTAMSGGTKGDVALIAEAKKYKTAEEFVSAQPVKAQTLDGAMQHRPTKTGATADNVSQEVSEMGMPDFYEHPEHYNYGGKAYEESINALMKIKGKPNADVTIYRAAPKDKNTLRTGDWVTLSKEKAKMETTEEGSIVHSFKVKAREIEFAGDDVTEFGYWGHSSDTKSQLADIWKKANNK